MDEDTVLTLRLLCLNMMVTTWESNYFGYVLEKPGTEAIFAAIVVLVYMVVYAHTTFKPKQGESPVVLGWQPSAR